MTRRQPEELKSVGSYLAAQVTPARIAQGRRSCCHWHDALAEIEKRYGVPAVDRGRDLGAGNQLWRVHGNKDVIRSMATLARHGLPAGPLSRRTDGCTRSAADWSSEPVLAARFMGRCHGAASVHAVELQDLRGRWGSRWPPGHLDRHPRQPRIDRQLPGRAGLATGVAVGLRSPPSARSRPRRRPWHLRANGRHAAL